VATVILGGLISSTLLDFFVHPALFWVFGRQQAEQQMIAREHDELDDHPTTHNTSSSPTPVLPSP
jgi:hypothetical protein